MADLELTDDQQGLERRNTRRWLRANGALLDGGNTMPNIGNFLIIGDVEIQGVLTANLNVNVSIAIANTTVNGLMSIEAQSFAGIKTFVNNAIFSANINVSGVLTGNGFGLTSVTAIDTVLAFGKTEINLNVNNAINFDGLPSSFYRDASNLNAGTVPVARLPIANTTLEGIVSLVAQSFAGVKTFTSNTVFSANITFSDRLTGNGAFLTTLNASELGSGTVPTARLGSGTANSTTFLAGDQTYKTIATGIGLGDAIAMAIALG